MDAFKLNIDGKDILLYRCTYAPVKSNMFIIIRGKDAIVIDPNDNPEGLKLLKDRGVEVIHILLTHEHFDHTVGVPVLQQAFPQNDLFCQEEAEKYISSKRGNNPMLIAFVLAEQDKKDGGDRYKQFKANCKTYTLHADTTYGESADRVVCGVKFHFIHTPGHSGGSGCIELGQYVFTGDSLLKEDQTKLRFPEGEKEKYKSITLPYLKSLPMDTIILPGHGDPFIITESKFLWD